MVRLYYLFLQNNIIKIKKAQLGFYLFYIELLVNQNSQSQFRHFLEIAPITIPDDMVFTDKQIQQIDEIALQVRNGKLSRNEAILALRAGGGWVNGAVIFLFMMFANWLSEVQGFGILLP